MAKKVSELTPAHFSHIRASPPHMTYGSLAQFSRLWPAFLPLSSVSPLATFTDPFPSSLLWSLFTSLDCLLFYNQWDSAMAHSLNRGAPGMLRQGCTITISFRYDRSIEEKNPQTRIHFRLPSLWRMDFISQS